MKLFIKSGATISKRKLGCTGKARALTGHQQDATLDKFYDKTDIDETIEYAQEVAKVYQFKKTKTTSQVTGQYNCQIRIFQSSWFG